MSSHEVNIEAVSEYLSVANDEPIVMMNLVKFKSPEHAQLFVSGFQEYVSPFLEKLGAETLYAGLAGPEFCANEDWDMVAAIRYPNFAALHSLVTDESIGPILAKLREENVQHSQLIVTKPTQNG